MTTMSVWTTERIRDLFEKTSGQGWEPRCGRDDPRIKELIERGFLKHCVMRCIFEAMDTGVTWTDAARLAFEKQPA